MTDRLLALRTFVRTARSGSLSSAGRVLRLSQPSVSRILAQLESEVGAALLSRTTRGIVLTEAGAEYLERIEPLLAALEEADHAVRGTGELRGGLRVALSVSFGTRVVVPRLSDFIARHSALKIELGMSDARQDMISDGFDVALRIGSLPSPTAIIRKVGQATRLLVASPAYIERKGMPKAPGELATHSIILGPGGSGPRIWEFTSQGGPTSVCVESRLRISANEGATAAALAGLGIANTSIWGCDQEIARGDLIRLMEDWPMEPAEVYAIFPPGRSATPAARAFVDWLASQMQTNRPDI